MDRKGRSPRGVSPISLKTSSLASRAVVADINRDIIFELIRSRHPISRAELSRLSGFQPSTTSAICEQLLRENWILEAGPMTKPRGRPSISLSLNINLVIAVGDIRPAQASIAIVDMNGQRLLYETFALATNPKRSLDRIISSFRNLLHMVSDRCVQGIGLSVPGCIDPATLRLNFTPNLQWQGIDIKAAIEKAIPLYVELDNAANACMLSELWFGKMHGVRDAVLLTISEGIDTSILANGRLVSGHHGLAGEFGHSCFVRDGLMCGCGRKGCWEMYASSRAALRYFNESQTHASLSDIHDLLRRAVLGDLEAKRAMTRQADCLIEGLQMIVSALSPELIILTGVTASWDGFAPVIQNSLNQTVLAGSLPRVSVLADLELVRLRGAAALVLQRLSGHRPTNAHGKDRLSR